MGVTAETDGGDQVDQLAELAIRQLSAGVAFVQNALELGVLRLDFHQRLVDALADVGLFGCAAELLPSRGLRHPKDVDFTVVVTVFQFFR
ncbi:hypothetical protein D3C72_2385060 [compost metagenome]